MLGRWGDPPLVRLTLAGQRCASGCLENGEDEDES